ncbi:Zn-dependent hydrolase [Robertmurraya yapensis]|uniref:Zn-dependent hydrolase n=1 Tax=Bacillus yapensis TaxID=2492960 RepID=A0A431WKA4_9BACI|nr:Zn-dependent hydrolase [Bacillus yapensis]RTR35852.1 Zn-dependent hydrolase [Bacillus yapensis]TKS98654.1 hydantoinase/carbamoylase family amidase [Bacillus yapensis]
MEKQKILINGERLKDTLEEFADFGRTENNGVTRLALSEEDRLARDYFYKCCHELGMSVRIDDMGNIYATLEGVDNSKPPIVIGSHLDSVKKGGRFDGVLGVIAGLEVARTLVENNIKPRVPLTIMDITNEEGARFEPSMMSSGVLSGKFEKGTMLAKRDIDGITFHEALQAIGYEGDENARLKEATAFLELHIEQGPILEREGLPVAVVESVLGMVCYELVVTGESDHAGTTPMDMRKDALFAATNMIAQAREKLRALDSDLVFTMGRINAYPNIHTVIPNKVIFTLEARHKDPAIIQKVEEIILELTKISSNEGCNITAEKLWDRQTVFFNEELCDKVEEACKTLGYPYKRMDSGAGHDAQFLASYIPTVMVFVKSIHGKSHCEEELTMWEDCEKGVNILLETVLSL